MIHARRHAPRALVLACSVLIAACAAPGEPASQAPSVKPVGTLPVSAVANGPGSCGSTTLSIDYIPFTVETLAGYDWDFVVADVIGAEPAFYNTPDGTRPEAFTHKPTGNPDPDADPAVYTPIDIRVTASIRSSISPGPNQVLVLGGSVGCFKMWVSPTPAVVPGSRYVFILSEAHGSDGRVVLPSERVQFTWPVNANGDVMTVDGVMSLDELAKIVENAAPAPTP